MDSENLGRLAAVSRKINAGLRVSGEPHGIEASLDRQMLAAGMDFTFVTDFGDLDLFGEIRGIGKYEATFAISSDRSETERRRQSVSQAQQSSIRSSKALR